MDRIGEIDRRGAARQGDQVALRGEGEDLVLEHLELGVLEKFLGIDGMFEDFEQFAQPAVLPTVDAARLLLVDPVRGDAELGHLMHVAGADLDLDALPLGPDHAGMERTVIVRLRRRDVVFEAAGDDVIGGMDDPQRVIAIADPVDQHAEGHHVGQLLERDVLALHLAPDRIGRFFAAGDARRQAAFLQGLAQLGDDPRDDVAALLAQEAETRDDAGPRIRIELGKGEILELVLHPVHADALGERDIDVHRLARDPPPLLRVLDEPQRLHVVQAIGELDQEDANVLGHGENQLAEVFRLLGLVRLQLDPRQFGDAVDEAADIRPEQLFDVVERRDGVLDRVVQQAR